MPMKVIEKFFSFARCMFFEEISPKFRTGSLKKFMDFVYVIFEKIAHKFDIISSNYLKLYDEIVEKEINMADISSEDFILVIGCGSLPSSSALIAMKTKANVVSIDTDPKAVHNASLFVKHLALENIIKLEQADGLCYPVEKFDVIFVLYGVRQQKEILDYLAHNMKENARIVYRTVTEAQDEILGDSLDLSKWFLVKNSIRSEVLYLVDSYLLLKKIPH